MTSPVKVWHDKQAQAELHHEIVSWGENHTDGVLARNTCGNLTRHGPKHLAQLMIPYESGDRGSSPFLEAEVETLHKQKS